MPLDVVQLPVGPFPVNCYLVRHPGADEVVVIDPGFDASGIRLELARRGARCVAILVTHGDVDHVAAVADLAEGTLVRIGRVVGGATFSARSPFAHWHEDVRALGFLRPPWGLAYDRLLDASWGDSP